MPDLDQIIAFCKKRALIADDDEIISAIDAAGYYVYTQVLKEQEGYFLKTDNTTVTLTVPSSADVEQQIYELPADLDQVMWMGERPVTEPGSDWDEMVPAKSLGETIPSDQEDDYQQDFGGEYASGDYSTFKYYGPYLPAANTGGVLSVPINVQTQVMQVFPIVDEPRQVLIVYHAKWMPIIDSSSPMMMANEGTYAMQYIAASELLDGIDDSRSESYKSRGEMMLRGFLNDLRDRQGQKAREVQPYLT